MEDCCLHKFLQRERCDTSEATETTLSLFSTVLHGFSGYDVQGTGAFRSIGAVLSSLIQPSSPQFGPDTFTAVHRTAIGPSQSVQLHSQPSYSVKACESCESRSMSTWCMGRVDVSYLLIAYLAFHCIRYLDTPCTSSVWLAYLPCTPVGSGMWRRGSGSGRRGTRKGR
ncbi:hypothetical protein IQ07DRAFT_287319 [Pyrenochaeta sp. DS3sAY3a]|nr:hypothetical protein IQ07DRAFT_287319 [Pyrenochaeta sp. DS3sAY3a]